MWPASCVSYSSLAEPLCIALLLHAIVVSDAESCPTLSQAVKSEHHRHHRSAVTCEMGKLRKPRRESGNASFV